MALLRNPQTGEIVIADDPTGALQQGFTLATDEEADAYARQLDLSTAGEQAQAFAERAVRGATLGAVQSFEPGMGATPESTARGEVFQEQSPVAAFAADVVPDVAVSALTGGLGGLATGAGRAAARGAVAEGAGLLRAGLAAGRAGGAAALAAESLGGGLVGAGQAASAEGQYLGEDLGRDAENLLFFGGLNFGLGAFALRGAKHGGRVATEAAEEGAIELDDVARAAELDAAAKGAPEARAPAKAPLEDLQMLDAEGMLERVSPDDPRVAALAPELDALRAQGIAGKSLSDLRALPLEGGPGEADSFAKVAAFEQDETFLREGMLPSNNDRGRGGLPALSIDPDGVYLQNGRHRLTAARNAGLDEIVMNVKKYDADGNTLWDYVGPVRISELPAKDALTAGEMRIAEREAVEDGVQRAVARASRSDAEDIVTRAVRSEPEAEAPGLGRQRRLYINRDAVMQSAEREFRDDLNAGMGELQRVVKGEKQAIIAGKVSANEGAQRAVADGIAQDAAKFAGELRGEARAYAQAAGKTGVQYAIPGAKSLAAALMDHAKALGEAKTGKALFSALDDFKRASQEIKLSLEAGALNSTNPIHHQQLIPRIDSFEKKIRAALEDSGTWGPAGEMQRAYNAVISDKLMPSLRTFEESVMERTHRGYDGLWKMEGWETKIRGLLANTDPGRRRHAAAVFDAMDELASVRRRFGDPKTAERLEASAAKMRRTIGLADEVTDATERMEALGTVAGAVPLFGGMARNMTLGNLQQAVDRLSGAAEAAAARGVDDWIRSSRARGAGLRIPLPGLGELSAEARQLRDVAVRRGVSQGMALFMGEDESPGAAFERLRDSLIDDEAFFESLSEDYGSLQQESPELFMALAGRAALARGFLLERMPPNVAVSVAKPNGHPPSREAIEDWSEYVNAVRHPERIARNLAGISVQQIETLRTVHPRFHELLQQRMLERIATAQQTGEQLDDTFLVRAGLLFPDLDGLASPVFSREFGKTVRQFNQAQKQKQSGGTGISPKMNPPKSPLQATIQGGPTFGFSG